MAVARELLLRGPREVVISALTRREAEESAAELGGAEAGVEAEFGNLFVPHALKDETRSTILSNPELRGRLLDDMLEELTPDVVDRSALGELIGRRRPDIIVDCVNTATAFAYQNIFDSSAQLRASARATAVSAEAIEKHLATLYMPQLIRHVQIALEAMRRARVKSYVKVGTSGTGGMGLNIPFTHSEERPSRMLLAKAGIAGAHTLLLYLMARTPDAPAVKEVKPTAAISWKRIAFGEVRRAGETVRTSDRVRALPIEAAFGGAANDAWRALDEPLQGVYIDAGENGLFSLGEFEALTALGLMEYVTPEEIAATVVAEIEGRPTGRDVVAALDASTTGPTYRAGVLREAALDRMAALERQHGVDSVAYEMLGPPRLSKLLFEAAILKRLYPDLHAVCAMDADETATRAADLIDSDAGLRVRILSIGLPILLPDGGTLLRGAHVKVAPAPGAPPEDGRLADNGWVDLRPANWRRWSERAAAMLDGGRDVELGSRFDMEPDDRLAAIRPGRMAAWVFRHEDRGERMKR